MSKELNKVLQKVEELVQRPGFIHAIAQIVSDDSFMNKDSVASIDWTKRLSYCEISFVTGLMIKYEFSTNTPTLKELETYIKDTYAYLNELHEVYGSQMMNGMMQNAEKAKMLSEDEYNALTRRIFTSKAVLTEAVFYADSGSYDFQYIKLAPELYQYDIEWLKSNNIDLLKNGKLFESMKDLAAFKRYLFMNLKLKPDSMQALDIFSFSKEELLEVAQEIHTESDIVMKDVDDFLNTYSCKHGDQNKELHTLNEMNIVNLKPIIEVKKNVYFCPVGFSVAEAIYESPAHWMRKDEAYRDIAGKHRGDTLEQIVYERFCSVFGDKFAFQSVKIMKGKKTLTDIDVLGIVGSKAIVVQAKGKGMTIPAREGVDEKVRADFKAAIQHGYDQGVISREVILHEDGYIFIDKNGKKIKLPIGIDEVYIMCITADVYPAVIHQLDVLLEKEKNQPWPIALSVFDLDLITTYLPDPYDFTFYVKQRTELIDVIKSDGGEIALLGYHLKQGLFKPDKADKLLVARDFAQLIDADYLYRNGKSDKPKNSDSLRGPWNTKSFKGLLDEIKNNISDPMATDIVFHLMTIPAHIREGMMKAILSTRDKSLKDGLPHNFNGEIGSQEEDWHSGFSYISASSIDEIRRLLPILVEVNKYKHKTDKWLGIGGITQKDSLSNALLFSWEPWQQSDEGDKEVERYNKITTTQKFRLNTQANRDSESKKHSKITKKKLERKNKRKGRRSNLRK